MAKPIFLVELPSSSSQEYFVRVREALVNKMEDYHVIVFNGMCDNLKFDCFYEKDFNEVKFEELKEIVRNRLNTTKLMSFEEWCEINEDLVNLEISESGADREMDFDSEKEFNKRYEKYLNNEI